VSELFSLRDIIDQIAAFMRVDGDVFVRRLLSVIGIWVLAWLAMWLLRAAARRIERAVDDGDPGVTTPREKRGQTIAQILRSVGRVVVIVVAGLTTFNLFVDIGPLLAGAGIVGLAFSFGAQSLVKDVISGFFMLMEDQFAVGDVIEAGGKSGVVEKMTLRVVVLRDLEGTMHIVPNGEIKTVSNRTRGWARAVLDIGVAYGVDTDRALDVVRDEARRFGEDPTWSALLDGPLEVPGVEALTDNSVVIRVLVRTRPGSQWNAGREFRRRMKKRFDAEGIEIPFPQRTVHVRVEPGAEGGDQAARAAAVAGGAAGA
jgi:small conductance mechanosensitive channel